MAMERPLGVAVIGCGWAGRRHAPAFMQSGAIVRWAIDTDQRRAAALPGLREDGHTATDYHVALADPAVDMASGHPVTLP